LKDASQFHQQREPLKVGTPCLRSRMEEMALLKHGLKSAVRDIVIKRQDLATYGPRFLK